jgi:outer membrane protein OmpA-like peptidoglycan-associated protein
MKYTVTLAILVVIMGCLHAQPERTELNTSYGISTYLGDLSTSDYFDLGESNFAFGAQIGMPVHPRFVVRAGAGFFRLSGTDLNRTDWRELHTIMSFETTLYEMNARLEWYPFKPQHLRLYNEEELAVEFKMFVEDGQYTRSGMRIRDEIEGFYLVQQEMGTRILFDKRGSRWEFDQSGRLLSFTYRESVRPFLFAGGAWARFNVEAESNRPDGETVTVEPQLESERLVIPFGGGIRYDFHPNWSLSGELGLRYTGTDYLDGFSKTRNPEANDWYVFAGVSVHYQLGAYREPQIEPADTDGDGVPDMADECPYTAGLANLQGCPDADGDGISDKTDECPERPGPISNKGCPLVDSDGDGILDENDQCPNTAGIPRLRGCPETDQDDDGVPDDLDECPLVAGTPALRGCPDADGDGIPDYRDDCPGEYGLPDYDGCPSPIDGQISQLLNGIPAVRFDEETVDLGAAGRAILNRVAIFLRQYPQYNLQITGHADDFSDEERNEQLSRRRASFCRQFLMAKGVSSQRLFYEGVGSSDPVTPVGETSNRLNRRATFNLFR